MPDDNIYSIPSENEQNSVAEEKKADELMSEQVAEKEAIADNPVVSEAAEASSQDVMPQPEIKTEQTQFNAQDYLAQQNINYGGQNSYNPQNGNYSSQGMYYSYSPNNYRGQYNASQQGYQTYYNTNPNYPQQPPKKSKKGLKIAVSVVGIVAIVTAACLFGYWMVSELGGIFGNSNGLLASSGSQENEGNSSYEQLIINSKPAGSDEYTANSDGTMTAAAVIEKVRPSIVGIVQYSNSANGIPTMAGQGSGIIISDDGFIVTNAHVVEGSSMITVVLDNDEEYRATLKGLDNQSDLAVLKIEEDDLPAAELGDSGETVVGESVIAIGNPGGLELAGSCTGGMVSGLDRTITSSSTGYAMTYIQTDAAINPGNSGGALVNMYGQVIGINSAKITSDGYENLGFAIPINEAIPIIEDLQRYGYVKNRAKIGISFQLITEAVSQFYNYSIPAGLLITEIDETCDIANKDVEINDIITKIDGKEISSASVLYSVLQNKKPGDTVKLTVYRIGTRITTSKTFDVTIVLSEDKGTE